MSTRASCPEGEDAECDVIRGSIRRLLDRHLSRPFEILRERGVVAQLFADLRAAVPLSGLVSAHLKPHRASKPGDPPRTVEIGRVQLEITVKGSVDGAPVEKAVDLVVLNREPVVHFGHHGHGDVLQQVDATSVAAAVEVKCSPSGDAAAGGEYAKDLSALLWLAEQGVSTFFVLLDKSSPRFHVEPQRAAANALVDWMSGPVRFRERRKVGQATVSTSSKGTLRDLGLQVEQERPSRAHVELWYIRPGGPRGFEADVRFVSLAHDAKKHLHLEAAIRKADGKAQAAAARKAAKVTAKATAQPAAKAAGKKAAGAASRPVSKPGRGRVHP